MSSHVDNFPVFVFPNSLKFYLLSRETHKQLLTLYNPADVPVRFRVLCTAPTKYHVMDPEGSIGPASCVDFVVRHTMPSQSNCNVTDKFKIALLNYTTKQTLGKKVVDAILINGEKNSGDREISSGCFSDRTSLNDDQRSNFSSVSYGTRTATPSRKVSYITAIILGIVCVNMLLLPTKMEEHTPSNLPDYLHISANLKIVAAYVLGIVTIVLFGNVG
ncbi:unnamed protein product [Brassicogethes aeneus]|uniref:MSP domain-containing protein n=1 Tax=Brassicogethes aeneus TaxID=1431903 RepID=A0A9P0ASR1_BRAAE|nr:unnamed protein product [Brassicogethes aeneus]